MSADTALRISSDCSARGVSVIRCIFGEKLSLLTFSILLGGFLFLSLVRDGVPDERLDMGDDLLTESPVDLARIVSTSGTVGSLHNLLSSVNSCDDVIVILLSLKHK